jgi:hypothetical protein
MTDETSDEKDLPLWKRPSTFVTVYASLAVAYFLPALLPGAHIYGTDYLAAGFFKHAFASPLIAEGTLPAWLPNVFAGVPLFANPAGTFYPVKLAVDLVLPVSKLYPAVFVVQFTLAGVGMYLLAREIEVRRWIVSLAALVLQSTGIAMFSAYALSLSHI